MYRSKQLINFLWPALILVACNAAPHSKRQDFTVALEAMPTQLDPRFATDANSSRVDSLVFASLAVPGEDGGYRPYLAQSWEHPDPLTYIFRLRSDFHFQDGRPVTARDVVATYRGLRDPSSASPRTALLSALDSVHTEGDRVVFRLKQADAAFMETATFAILSAEQARLPAQEPRALVASGPYRIVEVKSDRYILLRANGDFPWGRPAIPTLRFRIIPEATMRALELEKGSVDFVENAIDPDTLTWLAESGDGHTILRGPSNTFQYLGINHRRPVLADLRVRRAIAYAIDREAIVRFVLKQTARPASGLLPPHHWAYARHVRSYPYDPVRAGALLDRAGYRRPADSPAAPRLTLSYKTTTQELSRRVAEVLAYQLAQVGIHLDISTYEWGTFYADIKSGNFDLYSLAWVGIADPDIMRLVFHSAMVPPAGNNRGAFANRRMDRLTEAARGQVDRARRRRLYVRAQRTAARELPYVPLWWPDNIVVTSPSLQGFTPQPSGDLLGLARARLAR